jgi:hypothetical protein
VQQSCRSCNELQRIATNLPKMFTFVAQNFREKVDSEDPSFVKRT